MLGSLDESAFRARYGRWAVVTGGASGIGACLCRELARRGLDLLPVDVQGEKLEVLAGELEREHGVQVEPQVVDLSKPNFLTRLRPAFRKKEIGLLANNAAWGTTGTFLNTPAEEMLKTLEVNCRAPMLLAHELGRAMSERRRGGIIFTASSAAFYGTPRVANYSATKAYNLILAESLWDELRERQVDVLAFCPGPTDTPAFRSQKPDPKFVEKVPVMKPEEVARQMLAALAQRRPSAIAGRTNQIVTFVMSRLLSRRRAAAMSGKNTRMLFPEAS